MSKLFRYLVYVLSFSLPVMIWYVCSLAVPLIFKLPISIAWGLGWMSIIAYLLVSYSLCALQASQKNTIPPKKESPQRIAATHAEIKSKLEPVHQIVIRQYTQNPTQAIPTPKNIKRIIESDFIKSFSSFVGMFLVRMYHKRKDAGLTFAASAEAKIVHRRVRTISYSLDSVSIRRFSSR